MRNRTEGHSPPVQRRHAEQRISRAEDFLNKYPKDPLKMSVGPDTVEHMFDTPNNQGSLGLEEPEYDFAPDDPGTPDDLDSVEWVPADLDDWEPGPVLAVFMSGIDVNRLSGDDRVVVLRTHQRLASYFTAKAYEDMVAIADALRGI